jgi:multidrug efflux pump subunit AcrA (membrane-fusion protein)
MKRWIGTLCGWTAVAVLLNGMIAAQEKKESPPAKPPAAAPPAKTPAVVPPAKPPESPPGESGATYKVKKELFKIEVSLKGIFEAERMTEIALRSEQWAAFEVLQAVEHGATVKRGDVLLRFDPEKIDDEIADLRIKAANSESALRLAEENLRATEASTPLDLKAAQRARQIADEDLALFLKVDRQLSERSAENSLKSSVFWLDQQKEELRQLEKMYRADDLTEETEEIVLKRARHGVEMAEFSVENARARRDESLKVEIPRKQETLQQATQRQDIAWTKAKATLPVALEQTRRDLEKLKVDRARDQKKLKDLLADRELMTIKAPTDGVVYYGRFVRGKWSGMEPLADSLRRGGSVPKNAVVMTVVQARPLWIRSSVTEADLEKVRPGMKATVRPAAFPDMLLAATVARVDAVPAGADSFEARLELKLDEKAAALVPGMTCTVKLVPYLDKAALVAPAKAVFSDELDEEKSYVYVTGDGGKTSAKRPVTVGKRSEERVEIVRGLAEGDAILLERPKDAAPAAGAKTGEGAKKKE